MGFRMKRVMREGDTLARLGGDEFAAVMLDLHDAKACSHSLNRLLAAASKEAQIGDFTLCVSASAGVTFYPQGEEVDAEVLLRQAGQAMYQAKLAGKSRYHKFDPSEDMIARSRHENLEHLRKALVAQQFVLHYQPKVNMRTGAVVGAEALIRWQHPDRGLLPPGMFLPVIEDHQLAVDLGDWVIESALSQMEAWQSSGLDLPISVNVSAFELQQPDFADRLAARLAKHPAIKPSNLELEVLETSALQDVVQASQVLKACRGLGVSISLDDFGTGYSSLSYLTRLPANILKIDQSFVRDMLEEPDNMTILEGVLGIAAAFRREVIAEGVETVEHGLMLLQMGCDLGQGHGIARPMPADELQPWIATWHPDPRWADVPRVNADNRAVMYASVEHYAWLGAFDACLQGKRSTPPSLDASQCRIAAWLSVEKQSARRTFAAIQAIDLLHQQIHALAEEIFLSQSEGRNSVGLARLRELTRLHDKCLTRLKSFMRPGAGKIGKDGARSRSAVNAGTA
jgi:EAL domain-containing protein (putative c-di-GMP-specific phosphodiesterase class I)